MLFLVGSVSASEKSDNLQVANETDTVSAGEDAVISDSDMIVMSSTENAEVLNIDDSRDILQATGDRADLQSLIDSHYGEEITLQQDYLFTSGTNDAGVTITSAITINGNGKTIDAAQTGRVFNITGENVILKNIIFKNGNLNGYGAFIYSDAKYLTVDHCDFYNGVLTGRGNRAGAIYFNQGYGNVTYCNFEKNQAIGDSRGGAIYLLTGYTNIDHSTFKNNTVLTGDGDAGAIWVEGKYSNITYCTFESNACVDAGMDIVYVVTSNTVLYNCSFKNSYGKGSTDHDGSSIDIDGCSNVIIDKCTWTNCSARSGVSGAIYTRQTCLNVQITNSLFINNTAREWGGAITVFPDAVVTGLVIKNNTFINNTAGYGGAIAIKTTKSTMTIEDCKFYNNTAIAQEGYSDDYTGNGGAIYANCYTELKDCVFEGNKATVSGGAVYTTDVCSIKDSNFTSNNAAVYGGAIYDGTTDTTKTFTITDARFVNNHADENGGALYLIDGAHVTYDNLYYSGNTAPTNPDIKTDGVTILIETMYVQVGKNGDGLSPYTPTNWTYAFENVASNGKIYLIGGDEYAITDITISKIVTIEGYDDNVVFNANHAGRIFTVSITSVTIKNIYFKNAYFEGNGAAIYWDGNNGLLQNCTFDSCESYANSNNGAVFWNGENGVVDHCTFINNKATWSSDGMADAGALCLRGNQATIKNSYFKNNSGQNDGAAILISASSSITKIDIFNCTFIENKIETTELDKLGRGGAISVWTGTGVTVDSCNFTGNTATSLGGAIYWQTSGGTVTNCNFDNNEALTGGAIYWNVDGGSISNSNFTGNKASDGSAIYLNESVSTFEIKDSKFTSNEASGYGTVAAKQLTTLSLGGNTFTGNTVSSGATEYYFYDNTPTITASVVYVSESSGSASSNGLTADNPTTWAHAYDTVLEDNGKIILLNEEFTTIVAKNIGRTISIVGSGSTVLNGGGTKRFFTISADGVTIENITFKNGYNGGSGGAITWAGDNGNLINCTFTGNVAGNHGDAVYWTGSDGTIDKSTFGVNNIESNNLYSAEPLTITNTYLYNQLLSHGSNTINYGTDEIITGTFVCCIPNTVYIYLNGENKGSASVSQDSYSFSKTLSLLPVGDYEVSLKDENNNTYTFESNSFTVNRLNTVYISSSGTGSGNALTNPTTWDNVANIITSTGTVYFTDDDYSMSNIEINNAWTLTASSKGSAVITGDSTNSIFVVKSAGVTINNLKLTNGNVAPISVDEAVSSVSVTNSELQNQIEVTLSKSSYIYDEDIPITGSFGKITPSTITAKSGETTIGTSTDSTASYTITRTDALSVGSYAVSSAKISQKRRQL